MHRFEKNKWIFWKERLYVERLEGKTTQIQALLKQTTNNWDAVLFQLLAKGFGLNKNGITFLEMAQSIPFYVIQKCQHDVFLLEALFFGQLGLLEEDKEGYHLQLKKEYEFLKLKFKLKKRITHPPTFGRLRPANFPTVRIAQLAQLYHHQKASLADGRVNHLMSAQIRPNLPLLVKPPRKTVPGFSGPARQLVGPCPD